MQLLRIETGIHTDSRRTIEDFVLPADLYLGFQVRQYKTVRMTDEAVAKGLVVGNHFHTFQSNRHEFFVAMGPEGDLFEARFKDRASGNEWKFIMGRGDAILVVPMTSHAFKPLQSGACLIGLSNLPYDSAHDVPDPLF